MKNWKENKEFLLKISDLDIDGVYRELNTSREGLTSEEAELRLKRYGKNQVLREKPLAWYWMLLSNFKNPFIVVLIILGAVSFFTGDIRATVVVSVMVLLSVLMRFIQEFRSSSAAEKLRDMVLTRATVKRRYLELSQDNEESKLISEKCEIPFEELVPGDIIYLSAGDMIPADGRLTRCKDLFISQSALTGESMPVEKYDTLANIVEKSTRLDTQSVANPLERNNLCFLGTSVISGTAKAIVITTGAHTYFGSLASHIIGHRSLTSFDKGVNSVTWLLIRFILVMIPIVF